MFERIEKTIRGNHLFLVLKKTRDAITTAIPNNHNTTNVSSGHLRNAHILILLSIYSSMISKSTGADKNPHG